MSRKDILAFTDPHGDVEDARRILDLASRERPDMIVCAGDFSLFGNNWRAFLEALRGLERKVYVVGGNHEADGLMYALAQEYPYLVDVAFTTLEENGILVGGLPGYDRDFWPSKKQDPDVVAMARDIWGKGLRAKPFVFLSHYPPAGAVDGLAIPTPDAGGSATVAAIVRALEPDLVVTGHYHQDFGNMGWVGDVRVVNPGPSGAVLPVWRASFLGKAT
jgi:Icc-related predicted phosphoesterase